VPHSGAVPRQPSIGAYGMATESLQWMNPSRIGQTCVPWGQSVPSHSDSCFGSAVLGRALAERGADLADSQGQAVARLGAFDPDRSRERIAVGHGGLVAAIGVRADLTGQGVLGLDHEAVARLDPQAGLVVPAELVVERPDGEMLHGCPRCRIGSGVGSG
jgi:hypothetical protein